VRMLLAVLQKEALDQSEIVIRPSLVIRASTGGE